MGEAGVSNRDGDANVSYNITGQGASLWVMDLGQFRRSAPAHTRRSRAPTTQTQLSGELAHNCSSARSWPIGRAPSEPLGVGLRRSSPRAPLAGRGPPSPGGCGRRRLLPLCRGRGPGGHLAGRARPPCAPGLREPRRLGLDRNEVGALLVAAGLGTPVEHALISLLALNGLRVSEAIGADIEALGLERTDWVSPEFDRSPGAMRGELVPLRGDERLRWVQRVDCQPVRATWVPVL